MSRSTALGALGRFGILQSGKGRTHPGQLPFGYDYRDYRLVKNQAEQGVIRLMRQGRAGGLSLRDACNCRALSGTWRRSHTYCG